MCKDAVNPHIFAYARRRFSLDVAHITLTFDTDDTNTKIITESKTLGQDIYKRH